MWPDQRSTSAAVLGVNDVGLCAACSNNISRIQSTLKLIACVTCGLSILYIDHHQIQVYLGPGEVFIKP